MLAIVLFSLNLFSLLTVQNVTVLCDKNKLHVYGPTMLCDLLCKK